jgi:formylglycine-generating enzyme required for sulfatase activity
VILVCLIAIESFAAENVLPEYKNKFGIAFLEIPAGSFSMGEVNYQEPVREVTISRFYLAKYEVTYKLWYEIHEWAITHGYDFDNPGITGYDPQGDPVMNPVAKINWYDAVKWCNALSEKEGKIPVYHIDPECREVYRSGRVDLNNECVDWTANGYRLPTEAEWEYADRAGTTSLYPWGKECQDAYRYAAFKKSAPVGNYLPNRWGLFDMSGNAREWCWDWYSKYPKQKENNPVGPNRGEQRILRGGTCCFIELLYSGYRNYNRPAFALKDYGLRVACREMCSGACSGEE